MKNPMSKDKKKKFNLADYSKGVPGLFGGGKAKKVEPEIEVEVVGDKKKKK